MSKPPNIAKPFPVMVLRRSGRTSLRREGLAGRLRDMDVHKNGHTRGHRGVLEGTQDKITMPKPKLTEKNSKPDQSGRNGKVISNRPATVLSISKSFPTH